MNNIKKPIIKICLDEKNINEITDEIIYDSLFIDNSLNKMISNIEFNGCKFKNIKFMDYPLNNIDFIDCVFDECNLLNMKIIDKTFLRCRFNNCSMQGVIIIDSSIKDVIFNDCNLKYINISSRLNNVLFRNCNISSARIFDSLFKKVIFDMCDLSYLSINKTSLNNMDLSTCKIDNINADIESIKGVTTDINGVIILSKIFDINVKL